MTYVEAIVSRLPNVAKPQLKFLVSMFAAFFAFLGKANMSNLHRYGAPHPRTQARWHQREFDFARLNLAALEHHEVSENELAVAMDATFIPKSGKHTYGLGSFYNGCHSRPERGLELSVLALVDLCEHSAYALDAAQTPAVLAEGMTKNDFYIKHLKEQRGHLPPTVEYLLVDGAFANKPFVDASREEALHVVSKLRKDADMKHYYRGPRRTGRGRPKTYDGKVVFDDLRRWNYVGHDDDDRDVKLYEATLYHRSLKRKIRVLMVSKLVKGERRYTLLFTTDILMSPWDIYRLYSARFQIEFVFRDAKQFTGLCDAQTRSEQSLDFHFNMSLAALNMSRLHERARNCLAASIASFKRRNYNRLFMNRISDVLGLDLNSPKIKPHIESLCNYGVLVS